MSDVDLEQLNDMQLDVLKEIGNIGAGNATTALSTMLNVKMDMSVPNVALIQFKDISTIIGSEDQTVVGILLGLEGDIDGMMLFIFDTKSAHHRHWLRRGMWTRWLACCGGRRRMRLGGGTWPGIAPSGLCPSGTRIFSNRRWLSTPYG